MLLAQSLQNTSSAIFLSTPLTMSLLLPPKQGVDILKQLREVSAHPRGTVLKAQ